MKQVTVFMSELTKHSDKQYVKNTDSFRNQKSDSRLVHKHDSFRNTTACSMMHNNFFCITWNYFLADQI